MRARPGKAAAVERVLRVGHALARLGVERPGRRVAELARLLHAGIVETDDWEFWAQFVVANNVVLHD